jgi:steroid delta-isomerase-like uncharacterized protein
MVSQQNSTLVKRIYDEIYQNDNLSVADEIFTPDMKLIDPAAPNFRGGLSAWKERETMYKRAFPNKMIKIDDMFASEDRVVVYWTAQGTHKGPLQDVAPTGKGIRISGISIYYITNGKISKIIQNWDRLGLLEQIGVIEPAAALHQ